MLVMMDEATRAQNRAAAPDRSTWLAANAGSGKTRVLTDRVARLLLGGTDPQKILCLTFTKAAASEMQNRLFRRLGRWAMLEARALYAELNELGIDGPIGTDRLAEARRLFARAIETPGGLKIQTIHSFCAGLLRHFPLEARVSPGFSELDDRSAALIRRQILEDMAAQSDPGAVAALAGLASELRLDRLLETISRHAGALANPPTDEALARDLGIQAGLTDQDLLAEVLIGGEGQLLGALIPILLSGNKYDNGAARKLARAVQMGAVPSVLKVLEGAVLTGAGAKTPSCAKVGSLPGKELRKSRADELAPLLDEFEALMLRVEAARPQRVALDAFRKTRALYRFAAPFVARYAAFKAERGLLDFDDLIERAGALLSDPAVAPWVLYRLDGGIDHILVDEAQDTSPAQWQVIERLAEEFTAGDGAGGGLRTLFVVGDKKQSIYSFQGADLRTFDRMRDGLATRHQAAGLTFQTLQLRHSFRSSPAILRIVDACFPEAVGAGLGGATVHEAFHPDRPGRVDLWVPVPKADKPARPHWSDPAEVDLQSEAHDVLADRIAAWIKATIVAGTRVTTKDGPRPLHAGDFLILVRKRSDLFRALIRCCKAAGLPVAGADRLTLGEELAVGDILSLLRFLALPEDDLSLAEALRSPLFGWSEAQLFALAQPRPKGGYLWQALREGKGQDATKAMLDELRDAADFLRPYDLIERILTRHGGRKRLLARLGSEAEEGIDALLAEALNYERTSVPSLTGFLVWMDSGDTDIKRQSGGTGRAIRVMTVHGAKGLEAPVVILPDCARQSPPPGDPVLGRPGRPTLWRVARDEAPPAVAEAADLRRTTEDEENLRLLYVGMTRAESWLVVSAAGEVGKPGESWYRLVEAAMASAGAAAGPAEGGSWDFGPGLRHAEGDWPDPLRDAGEAAAPDPALPDWAGLPPGPGPVRTRPLSPSALGGAKALPGEGGQDEETAKRHGTLVHRLLETLPPLDPVRWANVARALGDGDGAAALAEAAAVLAAPDLAPLFGPDSLAEVDLAAPVADLGGRLVQGSIDRLIVRPDSVLAVDFKTNAVIPVRPEDVPDGILRQLGAYAGMLERLWPDRRIDLAIVWTREARLMPIPLNIVRAAMQDATLS
jgi:ATP-dependent helicase/nuclease subunit A